MNIKRLSLFIILLQLIQLPVTLGQGNEIKFGGTIFDMDTKQPLAGAVFILSSKVTQQSISALTDQNGKYSFTVPAGWEEGEYPMVLQKDAFYKVNGIVLVQKGAVRNFYMKAIPVKTAEATPLQPEPSAVLPSPGQYLRHIDQKPQPLHFILLADIGCNNSAGKSEEIRKALQALAGKLHPGDFLSVVSNSAEPEILLQPIKAGEIRKTGAIIPQIKCRGDLFQTERAFLLAYQLARNNYVAHGNNRVILITDKGITEMGAVETVIRKGSLANVRFAALSISGIAMAALERLTAQGGGDSYTCENSEDILYSLIRESNP